MSGSKFKQMEGVNQQTKGKEEGGKRKRNRKEIIYYLL